MGNRHAPTCILPTYQFRNTGRTGRYAAIFLKIFISRFFHNFPRTNHSENNRSQSKQPRRPARSPGRYPRFRGRYRARDRSRLPCPAPLRERRPHRTYVTDPASQSDRDGNRQGNVGPPHRHVRRVRLAWYRPDRCAAPLPRTRYRPAGNRETHIAATPRRQGIAVRSSVGRSMPSGFSRAASQSCAKTIRSGSIFNRSPGAPHSARCGTPAPSSAPDCTEQIREQA